MVPGCEMDQLIYCEQVTQMLHLWPALHCLRHLRLMSIEPRPTGGVHRVAHLLITPRPELKMNSAKTLVLLLIFTAFFDASAELLHPHFYIDISIR